jgi:hypothetical protein
VIDGDDELFSEALLRIPAVCEAADPAKATVVDPTELDTKGGWFHTAVIVELAAKVSFCRLGAGAGAGSTTLTE